MLKSKLNSPGLYLLWILATTIGWSAGVLNMNTEVHTYMDVLRSVPVYLINGLLIGLVAGLGQALILRTFGTLTQEWIWASAVGYGLSFVAGLVVSVLIPSIVWLSRGDYLLPFTEPSTVSMRLNMDDLFWGGLLIGIIQWRVLRKIIPDPNLSKAMAWALAPWFVLGLSTFVGALTHRNVLSGFQMGIMGVVMGAITGWILIAFLQNSHSTKQVRPRLYKN